MNRSLLFAAISLSIFCAGSLIFFTFRTSKPTVIAENQLSAVGASETFASPAQTLASSSTATTTIATSTTQHVSTTTLKKTSTKALRQSPAATEGTVERIQKPYATPALPFDQVNSAARAAIVNILCQPKNGSLRPISGSGVIIDPKGVILTNAHVAQYVLLSESTAVDLTCTVRTGSPAQPAWSVSVIFIPSEWVREHVSEINASRPTGTGEHDYALLAITGSVGNTPLPSQFPYIPADTRSAIGFPGDQVLVASYPAEFAGGIAAQYGLYANSSVTTIKQLMTFASGTPDVISLGGVIEAQSGSSGGAVVNAWGKLIGLIATTSEGATTADRDLRAIAMSYINADIKIQSGFDLSTLLGGDPVGEATDFSTHKAPEFIKQYVDLLTAHQ